MKIKLIALDVDGTLTNGSITHHSDGTESKTFDVKDGLILCAIQKVGIDTAIITGRQSVIVGKRAEELNIKHVSQNVSDKVAALRSLGYAPAETAYIGDDLNDYRAMSLCGFKACPADAAREIREICDYVSPFRGGGGAVRDICENILKSEKLWEKFLGFWV